MISTGSNSYVQQQWADDKAQSLTISDLRVIKTVGLDDIEQGLLAKSIGLKMFMIGEGSTHVPINLLLMCAGALQ